MPIYVHRNNQQLGPYTAAEVRSQIAVGALSVLDHVWWQGQKDWVPLGESPVIAGNFEVPGPDPTQPARKPLTGMSPRAIGALVCGLFSFLFSIFTAIPAIVLGHLALREIKRNPGRKGRGLALTGLIIGYFITLLTIALVGSYLAFLPELAKMADRDQAMDPTPIPNQPIHTLPRTLPASNAIANPAPPAANPAPAATPAATPSAPASGTNAAPMTP